MSSAGSSTSESNSSGSGVTLEHPTDALSIVQPLGYSASSCGYCAGRNAGRTRSGESGARPAKRGGLSYGCWAHRMTVKTYGDLLNLGWRRSGLYLYHPDNGSTCCPSLAIKLDAEAFTLSKSQRKLLRRFTGFMKDGVGEREGTEGWGGSVGEAKTTEEDSALSTALAVTFDPGQPRLEDQEEEGDYGGGKRKNVKSATALDKETEGKRSKGKNSGVQVDFLDLVHEGEWTREGTFRHKFEVGPLPFDLRVDDCRSSSWSPRRSHRRSTTSSTSTRPRSTASPPQKCRSRGSSASSATLPSRRVITPPLLD